VKLTDKAGNVVKTGRATTAFVTDWDGDGDLDILSGDIDGSVHLLRNESGGKALTFGEKEKVKASGEPIKAPGRNSGPIVADWDGDGVNDLILGCGDGSVRFYRNSAPEGEPVLGSHVLLVPASKGYPRTGAEATGLHGSRVKLAVWDWNGDGALDLLLGDFSSTPPPALELTEEQEKRKAELEAEQRELSAAMAPFHRRFQAEAKKQCGLPDDVDFRSLTDEQRAKYSEAFRKISAADEEYQVLQQKRRDLSTELRKFRPRSVLAGNVWLFLRRT
jgi:hypothetical protein